MDLDGWTRRKKGQSITKNDKQIIINKLAYILKMDIYIFLTYALAFKNKN